MKFTSHLFLLVLLPWTARAQIEHRAPVHLPEFGTDVEVRFISTPQQPVHVHFRIKGKTYSLTAKYGVNELTGPDTPRPLMLPGKNSGFKLSSGKAFLIAQYGQVNEQHTFLAFPGPGQDPNGADALLLVGFRSDGSPFKALERGDFGITSLRVSSRGGAVLYGWQSLSEVMGCIDDSRNDRPYATTYDPSEAYILGHDTAARYSLEKSRLYNQQHYVWAGRGSSEKIIVFHNIPHHPLLFAAPAATLDRYVSCR